MNAKQATFETLDKMHDDFEFYGIMLAADLNTTLKSYHYPDTYLRYMREYRQKTGRQIVCISREKSLYKILG
jgi:hypothetical protein